MNQLHERKIRAKHPTFWIYAFLPGLIWWLASFPARLSADSLVTISAIKSSSWNSMHGLSTELFVWVTSLHGNCIWLTSLIQIIAMPLSLLFFLDSVDSGGQRTKHCLIAAIVMATPYGGGIASTIWADALNGIFGLLLLGFVVRIFKSNVREEKSSQRKNLLFCSVLGLFFLFIRAESILIFGVLTILLFLGFINTKKRNILRLATYVLSLTLIALFLNLFVASSKVIVQPPKYYSVGFMLKDLSYMSLEHPGNLKLKTLVQQISTGDSLAAASYCETDAPFIFSKGFIFNSSRINKLTIVKNWLIYSLNNPIEVLKQHYCLAKPFLPFPASWGPSYVYWVHPGIDSNSMNLRFKPFLKGNRVLGTLCHWIMRILADSILWPGATLTLFFIFGFKRLEFFTRYVLSCLILSSVITLFIITPAQDFRYAELDCLVCLSATLNTIEWSKAIEILPFAKKLRGDKEIKC